MNNELGPEDEKTTTEREPAPKIGKPFYIFLGAIFAVTAGIALVSTVIDLLVNGF